MNNEVPTDEMIQTELIEARKLYIKACDLKDRARIKRFGRRVGWLELLLDDHRFLQRVADYENTISQFRDVKNTHRHLIIRLENDLILMREAYEIRALTYGGSGVW